MLAKVRVSVAGSEIHPLPLTSMARLFSIGDFPCVLESLRKSETVQATANMSTAESTIKM
jgi:hypothetical protein